MKCLSSTSIFNVQKSYRYNWVPLSCFCRFCSRGQKTIFYDLQPKVSFLHFAFTKHSNSSFELVKSFYLSVFLSNIGKTGSNIKVCCHWRFESGVVIFYLLCCAVISCFNAMTVYYKIRKNIINSILKILCKSALRLTTLKHLAVVLDSVMVLVQWVS